MEKREKNSQKELKKQEIGLQHCLENRWIARFFINKQAIKLLLNFLMTTDIRGRKKERKGAAEGNWRADKKVKKLLDSR